jgi:hydrogenase maturation protease
VVLGLGNPVVSDDRVGLAVADEVKRLLAERPVAGVEVAHSLRGGFELIDLLNGYERAILVDCVMVNEPAPGFVRELELDKVAGSARLVGSHELSVGEAFAFARKMGIEMPARVTIFGVEGGEVGLISEELTAPVAAAVAPLAARIYALLAAG